MSKISRLLQKGALGPKWHFPLLITVTFWLCNRFIIQSHELSPVALFSHWIWVQMLLWGRIWTLCLIHWQRLWKMWMARYVLDLQNCIYSCSEIAVTLCFYLLGTYPPSKIFFITKLGLGVSIQTLPHCLKWQSKDRLWFTKSAQVGYRPLWQVGECEVLHWQNPLCCHLSTELFFAFSFERSYSVALGGIQHVLSALSGVVCLCTLYITLLSAGAGFFLSQGRRTTWTHSSFSFLH